MKDTQNGFDDITLVKQQKGYLKYLNIYLALVLIIGLWLFLDWKLLAGDAWISETYDNPDWRTNEGNLHTYGAWDIETHIWKTEFIIENFPHVNWNPYWYLGMPLLKYYQLGFYAVNILLIAITGFSAAKSTLLLVIFGHLFATVMTFLLCYKVSRKVWTSALASIFLLSNTFISLRSYGWEPITVIFLFLFPLTLYFFLKEPLRPLRFSVVVLLGISYICHPLIWFALLMTIGVYLMAAALRKEQSTTSNNTRYLWHFGIVVLLSMMLGAVQFIPQMSYEQVTSGSHMGVKYLPFYQVPFNIITIFDFFFDAGNLKGPGPIIMIATLLLCFFMIVHSDAWRRRRNSKELDKTVKTVYNHQIVISMSFVLFLMVVFYYMELYNVFPMNIIRSIQYHRIIPEFMIIAAVLIAALSNVTSTNRQKIFYYSMLTGFAIASIIIIYNIQEKWVTVDDISGRDEFIKDSFSGRISFPYTDQSLAVRNSFTEIHQTYGYYEQGITNSYDDDIFSVSSGYHDNNTTLIFLKAADVTRLYVNTEEGLRDAVVMNRLNGYLNFTKVNDSKYSYFQIPIYDPGYSQAVDSRSADQVSRLAPGCRILFSERYCDSIGQEFVSKDPALVRYLSAYVDLLEQPYHSKAEYQMINPDHYEIRVSDAELNTAIVVKMTYDKDFSASLDDKKIDLKKFGPDFMIIMPKTAGDYTVKLDYSINIFSRLGAVISILSLIMITLFFIFREKIEHRIRFNFKHGDM